jgi:hypothetical protein
MNTTERKLIDMLTENTGRSMLDSGGVPDGKGGFKWGYGRNWERNQMVDFQRSPEATLEAYGYHDRLDLCVTLSVFHWLKDRLHYNWILQRKWLAWCRQNDVYPTYPHMEGFAESRGGTGIYGDGGPLTVNTYNGEDLLSQTIQYTYWTDDDGAHILLQIHGGCDVRGGYTDALAFDVTDYDGTGILDNARASIFCNGCGSYWDTDDACHWYPNGTCGAGYDQLEDYPVVDDPVKADLRRDLEDRCENLADELGINWERELPPVAVDDDHKAYCPHCGGVLQAAAFPPG